jgi:hypothetical protein
VDHILPAAITVVNFRMPFLRTTTANAQPDLVAFGLLGPLRDRVMDFSLEIAGMPLPQT